MGPQHAVAGEVVGGDAACEVPACDQGWGRALVNVNAGNAVGVVAQPEVVSNGDEEEKGIEVDEGAGRGQHVRIETHVRDALLHVLLHLLLLCIMNRTGELPYGCTNPCQLHSRQRLSIAS